MMVKKKDCQILFIKKSKIKKPSTSFLISLDRVGLDGKNIKIHKIRSMYKYSEFLHQGMLQNNELSNIGKILRLSNNKKL